MVIGLWHPGSGLGDQLFCYLAARITAERLGVPFSMVGEFKGSSFLTISRGESLVIPHHVEMPAGKIVIENDWPLYVGKTYYDPEFNFIEDNTIVDGCQCQDEQYWSSSPISGWLKTEPVDVPDDLCIVGFRGGEYATVPELFLTKDYWVEAMALMRKINPAITFRIVTDDPGLARTCFPHIEVTHDLSNDWRQVRHARYSIIANSAFYIFPRWLRHHDTKKEWQGSYNRDTKEMTNTVLLPVTIAPRKWARRNVPGTEWSTPQSYYPAFKYI